MLNKKLVIATCISIISCSALAKGDESSYSYIGLAYQNGEVSDIDYDGFGVMASVALGESVFLFAGYSDGEIDLGPGVDVTQYDIGFGFHAPINNRMDFVTSIAYVNQDAEIMNLSENLDGYSINAGFRGKPRDFLELNAFINFVEIEDERDTGFSVGVRYFFTPVASFGVGYAGNDDVEAVTFDARLDY